MTERRVYLLIGLAIATIAVALWVSSQRHLPRDTDIGEKLLPAFKAGELTEIDLTRAGAKRAVTLKIAGNEWTVGERDGYPADASKVRTFALGFGDFKIVEEKTSDPKNYSAIGVEEIGEATAGGTLVDLRTASGGESLLIGRTSGGRAVFVRKPGTPRSLLVAPQVFADPEPKNWLHRSIVDVAFERVQQASITTAKLTYVVSRKARTQPNFDLASAPKGKVLASEMSGNSAASSLAGLELEDVRKQDAARWQAPSDHTEIRTFDGWIIGVEGRVEGDRHWIRLTSRYDEAQAKAFPPPPAPPAAGAAPAAPARQPDVRKDAEGFAAKAAAWEYEVPKYKYDLFFKPLDEIVKKP